MEEKKVEGERKKKPKGKNVDKKDEKKKRDEKRKKKRAKASGMEKRHPRDFLGLGSERENRLRREKPLQTHGGNGGGTEEGTGVGGGGGLKQREGGA